MAVATVTETVDPVETRPAQVSDVAMSARISGVTPAAISLLLVHLKRGFRTAEPKTA